MIRATLWLKLVIAVTKPKGTKPWPFITNHAKGMYLHTYPATQKLRQITENILKHSARSGKSYPVARWFIAVGNVIACILVSS